LRVIHDNLLLDNPPFRKPPVPPRPKPPVPERPPRYPNNPHPVHPPPRDVPSDPRASPWDAARFYGVGEVVSYGGRVYRCTIPHQAQVDWTPPAAVSLWKEVSTG
jgi:hypothetical protein